MSDPNPLAALVRRLNPGHADVPDAELLDRFARSADQAAFELLVWRHGAMVWGVCRRVLGPDRAAAEDACQAAFVALARHAARLCGRRAVGAWLHRVAVRASIDLGRVAARQRHADSPDAPARDPDPSRQASDREVREVLDTGLNHLPDKLRVPFVLCELEGRTNAEAAALLGCPVGTVESRLTRARQRLRDWLTARGVVPAVATAAVALPECTRAALVRAADPLHPSAAVKALAARAIPPTVSAKARAVAAGLVLAVGAVGLALAQEPGRGGNNREPEAPKKAAPVPRRAETKEAAIKAMQERLQGAWKCLALHSVGVKSEPDLTLTIKGNTWETNLAGTVYQSGTFKLNDLDANPKQIEWVVAYSVPVGDKGKTMHGIFMLDGDSLISVHSDAAVYPRPQVFFTEPNDGCFAAMYKRVDPKKDR